MANPSSLGSICYEVEASFADPAVDTAATFRIPTLGPVDASGLTHPRIDPNRTQQYRGGGEAWIQGTMGGTITTETYLFGFGSSTSGATAITAYQTWLGIIFGNAAVSAASGTTLTGGTAAIPTTTASGTFSPGSLAQIGALGDGDGNGQVYAIGTHSALNLNLLTALAGAPVNGAVLYSGTMVYPSSSPTATTISSVRMLVQTANLQYLCKGCVPVSWEITGSNPAEQPRLRTTWAVAWWKEVAPTFPSTVATDTSNPASVASGSLWVNDVGTATNATRTCFNFQLSTSIGVELLRGPGGGNPHQDIIGARRTVDDYTISWTESADAATTSPVLPNWVTAKHVLYTLNATNGKCVAFYFPNVCPADPKPVQFADQNLNRLRFTGKPYTSSTTTSDLTLSRFRMLLA
jgi:hypothetical protein